MATLQGPLPSCIPGDPFRPQRLQVSIDLKDLQEGPLSIELRALVDNILNYVDHTARQFPHTIIQYECDKSHQDREGVYRTIYSQTMRDDMASINVQISSINPQYTQYITHLKYSICSVYTRVNILELWGTNSSFAIFSRYDYILAGPPGDQRQVMVPKGDGFFKEPPVVRLPMPLPTAVPRPIARPVPNQALQGLPRLVVDLERPSTPLPLPPFQSIREGEAGGTDDNDNQ